MKSLIDALAEGDLSYVTTRGETLHFKSGLPLHEAAKADQSIGSAYNSLVNLKLGFDGMHEIPAQSKPLYNEIVKAISVVAKSREATTQVREMVARKRY